ncbi:GNAT family N-acetyltransferase [Salisediminibacterium halotolerans]|uniref:GNAT family N-acetyltransferase n=1 Tax=Salisediminibacterium halotolerans TaxID=517425 RepID=UPI000EADE7DB|nr:GNAT family N-acetyltransferase [Salisediminibacterium halotolerans]RLJ74397.1 acetyltransferase (GNAT) family protein [Actinophytocola xinjiangensis]RPE87510.1 acetyltransferase (GNAT) family protein [Salisediminibacterium halotolerans]TWG35234.1 acetyltransferase (GNAT) family protein [Salisediminibacterium halotolerans]GEL08962.1 hypothetical protein SHA02_23780 [Salisediminibacterium halotolerans]
MTQTIRELHYEDLPRVEAMQNGIENDYVPRVFNRLTSGNNRIFGMFEGEDLISTAGYTVYAESYAMLGRLRSDIRYRGKANATTLLTYVLREAERHPGIQWIGANTQQANSPARRVLEKIGFEPVTALYPAATKEPARLAENGCVWNRLTSLSEKRAWVKRMYVDTGAVFPYECYYPFPASDDLFPDNLLDKWEFYENEDRSRFLLMKYDQKLYHYLHTVYPWDDFTEQPGLWKTIDESYKQLLQETDGETYVWMDMTEAEASALPDAHPFELPDPWVLYRYD